MSSQRVESTLPPPEQLAIAWRSASLLLDYPDEEVLAKTDQVSSACGCLPKNIGDLIEAFLEHLRSTPLQELQADYIQTFDNGKRCNLHLTPVTRSHTGEEAMELVQFKETYQRAGFVLRYAERPDHLCVVLEFAATVDRELGRDLMLDHRADLELLRQSLQEMRSPWKSLIDAVTATLPPLSDETVEVSGLGGAAASAEKWGPGSQPRSRRATGTPAHTQAVQHH